MALIPRLTTRLERLRPSEGNPRHSSDTKVHLSSAVDRAFRLNGNVRSVTHLSGSLAVETRVDHVQLENAVRVGGRRGVRTKDVVIKYISDESVLPSSRSIEAMQREGAAYLHRRRDPLGRRMIPADVVHIRLANGQKVPAIRMPFVASVPLRQGITEGRYTVDDVVGIQTEALDRTVRAIQRRRIRLPGLRQRMEIVSMRKLEQEKIWDDMEKAIAAVEKFYRDRIPEGAFRDAELNFIQRDPATGEAKLVTYPSLNVMQARIREFINRTPHVMAEGIDHDLNLKNAGAIDDEVLNYQHRLAGEPIEHVRVDKGYTARERSLLAKLFLRPGEAINASEAIFLGTKAVSLETLGNLGEVEVAYVQDVKKPHRGRLFIDATSIEFAPTAIAIEERMRERWPQYARQLQFPGLIGELEQWEAMSDLYEFIHAGKRVQEVLADGVKRSRPDAGLRMLQRMGEALERADAFEITQQQQAGTRRLRLVS